MPIDQVKAGSIVAWITELNTLLPRSAESGQTPADAWERVLRNYADFLYADFPIGAFTRDSLKAMAEKNEFFPSYKTLSELLNEWSKDNMPKPPLALPPPGYETAPADPEHWLRRWERTRGLRRGDLNPGSKPGTPGCEFLGRANLLSLIRARNSELFSYLVRKDLEAAEIATKHKWESVYTRADDLKADWDDPAGIEAKVQAIREEPNRAAAKAALGLLRSLTKRWAPQHLGLIPESLGPENLEIAVPQPASDLVEAGSELWS